MSEVTMWEAVHIRCGDSNIKYINGEGQQMVKATDYARLEQECERLRSLLNDAKTALDPFDDRILEAKIYAALSAKP